MSSDFWRQWQALGPFAWVSGASSAPPGAAAPGWGPFADSAERFAAAAREFASADGFGNFLREHFAGSFKPPWPPSPGPAPLGSAFTEAPALGLGREQVLRAQRAAEAWKRLMEAHDQLQRLWSDALREAATAFSSRSPPLPGETLTQEAIDRLYDQWIDCAEEAYARTAHSDAFSDALSAYANAGSQWRRECAAGIEEWAKLLDLPTRSEINALTLRLRELEARLKTMKAPPRRGAREPPPSARPPRPPRRARAAKPPRAAKPEPAAKSRAARSKRPK